MENGKWKIEIDLPFATSGNFIWQGKSFPLKAGKNEIDKNILDT